MRMKNVTDEKISRRVIGIIVGIAEQIIAFLLYKDTLNIFRGAFLGG